MYVQRRPFTEFKRLFAYRATYDGSTTEIYDASDHIGITQPQTCVNAEGSVTELRQSLSSAVVRAVRAVNTVDYRHVPPALALTSLPSLLPSSFRPSLIPRSHPTTTARPPSTAAGASGSPNQSRWERTSRKTDINA